MPIFFTALWIAVGAVAGVILGINVRLLIFIAILAVVGSATLVIGLWRDHRTSA